MRTKVRKLPAPVVQDARVVAAGQRQVGLRRAEELDVEAAHVREAIGREEAEDGDPRYIALLADLAGKCTTQAARIRANPAAYQSMLRCRNASD